MYFGYCHGGGNYICYVEPIVDNGPGCQRCRLRRLPPYGWWPLAVAGRITELGVLFLKRVDVFLV